MWDPYVSHPEKHRINRRNLSVCSRTQACMYTALGASSKHFVYITAMTLTHTLTRLLYIESDPWAILVYTVYANG